LVLSSGAMTKVSFFYFVAAIVPTLLAIRFRHDGLRGASGALFGLVVSSAPAVVYWLRWGRPALEHAKGASFGGAADYYYTPLGQFLRNTIRESSGIIPSFVLAAIALIYLVIRKRSWLRGADSVALLISIGLGVAVLLSPNREIRFALPVIVAAPFLIGILMSGKGSSMASRSAFLAGALVFCGLAAAAVPMRHRPDRQGLARPDSVLVEAARCNAKHILLATDSPTLNQELMKLAIAVSAPRPSIEVRTLVYSAVSNVPIAEDFRAILESDQVVFQDTDELDPPFTNQRASQYEQYARKQGRSVRIGVGNDVSVYLLHCR